VPANRVVSPVPPSRRKKAERRTATREVRKAALLQKAAEWRRQLDAVEVASQAEIARREGISRARVTKIMGDHGFAGRRRRCENEIAEPSGIGNPHGNPHDCTTPE